MMLTFKELPDPAFEKGMEFVLSWEGFYSNDRNDPGGETLYGISRKKNPQWNFWSTVDRARSKPNFPDCLKSEFLLPSVDNFYRQNYWDPAHCPDLHKTLQIAHFDAAVQHGPVQAIRLFQKAARIASDGLWGPITERHARMHGSDLLVPMLARRAVLYCQIVLRRPKSARYMYGWFRRLLSIPRGNSQ